ncbi:MAG: NADH-quinone oxidoreductase subunit NuoN [Thermoplasmata archaeon]
MISISYFLPEIFMAIMGFVILALGLKVKSALVLSALTFITLLIGAILVYVTPHNNEIYGLTINSFGTYFALIMIIASLFVVFPSSRAMKSRTEIFYALLIFVTIGMIFVALTWNLIVMFVSFETVSIGTYVLSAFGGKRRNLEATIKYFFTGAISTTFTVFGIAFFFFSMHTFTLTTVMNASIYVHSKPAMLLALFFLLIGFGFKLAIFPMHQWAIDAYDGTENSVSAFLSTGTKIVAFVAILKIFLVGFSPYDAPVYYFFTVLAILTMTYANVAALSQNNVKRLLAYSSVAQAGYLILVPSIIAFIGVKTGNPNVVDLAVAAGMFYALVYIFMKGGAFLAMNMVNKDNVTFDDIAGLGKKSPYVAVSFSILLLSLAGIPLTGGFLAKYFLFLSVIESGLWWLAIIAILNSAISVFYYMKVMRYLFWVEPKGDFSKDYVNRAAVIISAVIVVFLGVFYLILPTLESISIGIIG